MKNKSIFFSQISKALTMVVLMEAYALLITMMNF